MSLTVDEEKYVHMNSEYYESEFGKLRRRKNRASWNWAAFFLPTCWLFYRKIFGCGTTVVVISAAICLLGGVVTMSLALIFRVYIGLRGNDIYMQHIENVMRRESRLREPVKSRYMRLHSGTSMMLAVLAFIVMTTIECLIIYYFYI